jgi:hypothetical protein
MNILEIEWIVIKAALNDKKSKTDQEWRTEKMMMHYH